MLALGGVHGDEINGVEIVRRAVEGGYFDSLRRGSVVAIPLLNIYGFINYSRDVPDGKDVNRSFPGNIRGSLAARVARTLTKRILPQIDFGVDFHTGGRNHYNYPQIRFTRNHAASEDLARAFGAPYLLEMKTIPKSLRKAAIDMGKSIIVFEGGENQRYDGFSISKGLAGLQRLMFAHGMVDNGPSTEANRIFRKTSWVRATSAGLFLWSRCSGQYVRKGEILGQINDPYGKQPRTFVYAPTDGHLIGHNNAPVVNQGDALFHLATAGDGGSEEE